MKIEFEAPHTSICDCCGAETTKVTRFISLDGEAKGVYFGAFSDQHTDSHVSVLLSLGDWWEGTSPLGRFAFGLRIWLEGPNFQVTVVDAQTVGWPDALQMGRRLTRVSALKHPLIREVFHVSDHIVAEDPEIRAYFQRVLERRGPS